MNTCDTPLLDLLRIPRDARLCYEHDPLSHSLIPVGDLCNRAADEIERLRAALTAIKHDAEKMRIWNGQGWTWNPYHAQIIYKTASAAIDAARSGGE